MIRPAITKLIIVACTANIKQVRLIISSKITGKLILTTAYEVIIKSIKLLNYLLLYNNKTVIHVKIISKYK